MPRVWTGRYSDYLKTEHWRALAERVKEQAGRRCQICNSGGRLEGHHRTYDNLGAELPGDVIALCSDCHSKFHDKIVVMTAEDYPPVTRRLSPPLTQRPPNTNKMIVIAILEELSPEGWGECSDVLEDLARKASSCTPKRAREIRKLMVAEGFIYDAIEGHEWWNITETGRKFLEELRAT